MTERCVHVAQVAFPGAAERAKDRLFGEVSFSESQIGAARPREWRIAPILDDIGMEFSGAPEVFEVHNVIKR
jgi:hypothetical protein